MLVLHFTKMSAGIEFQHPSLEVAGKKKKKRRNINKSSSCLIKEEQTKPKGKCVWLQEDGNLC